MDVVQLRALNKVMHAGSRSLQPGLPSPTSTPLHFHLINLEDFTAFPIHVYSDRSYVVRIAQALEMATLVRASIKNYIILHRTQELCVITRVLAIFVIFSCTSVSLSQCLGLRIPALLLCCCVVRLKTSLL